VVFNALKRLFSHSKEPSLEHLPETFVVFDLETTGLDANKHAIIEVGAIRFQKGRERQDSFSALVKTKKRLSARITEITGIDKALLDTDGLEPSEVFPAFVEFIAEFPIVSYNYDFDGPFLASALKEFAGVQKLKNPSACALKMARRAWPGLKSYRLGDLSRMGKLDVSEEHRALGDTKRALAIYTHAADKLRSWQ
jgi:DNA polymerase III subunit epsilon